MWVSVLVHPLQRHDSGLGGQAHLQVPEDGPYFGGEGQYSAQPVWRVFLGSAVDQNWNLTNNSQLHIQVHFAQRKKEKKKLIQDLGGTSWILLPDDSGYPEFVHWVRVFACSAAAQAASSVFPIPPSCTQARGLGGLLVAAVAGQSPQSLFPHKGWCFSLLISQVICKLQISPSRNKTPSLEGAGSKAIPKPG